MAKAKAKVKAKAMYKVPTSSDVDRSIPFRIQIPLDGAHVPAGDVNASGTGSPDGSTVTGILTESTTGATIQSNPATSTIGGGTLATQTWSLSFQNVPAGTYVLAVQQDASHTGADAINVIVDPVVAAIQIVNITPGSTTVVTGNCDDATTVAGVVSSSKPKHGSPRTQSGSTSFTLTFTGLAAGNHSVTVYPLRGVAKAHTRTFTV